MTLVYLPAPAAAPVPATLLVLNKSLGFNVILIRHSSRGNVTVRNLQQIDR